VKEDNRTKISIIVPVYNVEKYLRECIDSLRNQTYRNIQVVLVDDGSTDASGAICDEYAALDPRFVVIHQENAGVSAARNAALDRCTGRYLGFMDSDDWAEPQMYETLYRGFEKNERVDIVNCAVYTYNDGDPRDKRKKMKWTVKEPLFVESSEMMEKVLSDERDHLLPTKLFRRSLFRGLRFKYGRVDEDTMFTFEYIQQMEQKDTRMLVIPDALFTYRQRAGSICHDNTKPLRLDRIANLREIRRYLIENRPDLVYLEDQMRVRSLVYFLNEILCRKEWKRLYLRDYLPMLQSIPNDTAKKSLSLKRYNNFLVLKYCYHIRQFQMVFSPSRRRYY